MDEMPHFIDMNAGDAHENAVVKGAAGGHKRGRARDRFGSDGIVDRLRVTGNLRTKKEDCREAVEAACRELLRSSGFEADAIRQQKPVFANDIDPAAVALERPPFTTRGAATRNGINKDKVRGGREIESLRLVVNGIGEGLDRIGHDDEQRVVSESCSETMRAGQSAAVAINFCRGLRAEEAARPGIDLHVHVRTIAGDEAAAERAGIGPNAGVVYARRKQAE